MMGLRFELAEIVRELRSRLDEVLANKLLVHYVETERDIGATSPGLLGYGEHYQQHASWVRNLAENLHVCNWEQCFVLKVYALAYRAMASLQIDSRRETWTRVEALRVLMRYV